MYSLTVIFSIRVNSFQFEKKKFEVKATDAMNACNAGRQTLVKMGYNASTAVDCNVFLTSRLEGKRLASFIV